MAGQKKKLRYSEETPWFPEYYIGWIEISNCGQKTSTKYLGTFYLLSSLYGVGLLAKIPPSSFTYFLDISKYPPYSFCVDKSSSSRPLISTKAFKIVSR